MPQHAARCCRAVHHHMAMAMAPLADGVWVTDSALANAFERYCRISRSVRRMASNVPGPLESRRRLGKRQMTADLGMQTHPSLPIWALQNAPDLSQWRWQPPSTPSSLRPQTQPEAKTQPLRLPSIALPDWLAEWGDKTDERDEADVGETELGSQLRPGLPSQPFFEELDAVLQIPLVEVDQLSHRFQGLCDQFHQQLALAALTTEDTEFAIDSLRDRLLAAFPEARRDSYLLQLYSAVVAGITSCKILGASDFALPFWGHLLSHISELSPSDESCHLLGKIAKALPYTFINQLASPISTAIMSNLAVPDELGSGRGEARLSGPESGRIAAITGVLESLDAFGRARILKKTTHTLRNVLASSVEAHESAARTWLAVLARSPRVRQSYLFDTLLKLQPKSQRGTLIGGAELCELLITQWSSRGYLEERATGPLRERINGHDDDARLAALALGTFRSSGTKTGPRGLLCSIWTCLRTLQREDELPFSLAALIQQRSVPLVFLEALADASDDVHSAVKIHSIYIGSLSAGQQPCWDPGLWEQFADRMALSMGQSLTLEEIFSALDMSRYTSEGSSFTKSKRHTGRKIGASTVALVEKLALQSACAPHLVNRQALRRVEQCRRFLAEHDCALPLNVLRAIFHVVTRDLASAQPGRTSRLRWFLGILREQYNDETSLECGLAFKRWRAMIGRYLAEDRATTSGEDQRLD